MKTLRMFALIAGMGAFLWSGIAAEGREADPDKITVSQERGTIIARFNGGGNKLIIHIQDAHCNYEAQSNIAKIVEGLAKDKGARLIAVEGADGMIDTSRFNVFSNADIRREIADYFMRKGEITGPEYLSITADHPLTLFGAETGAYYTRDFDAFIASHKLKNKAEAYYISIKKALDALKTCIYNDELKLLDLKSEAYRSGRTRLNDHILFLGDEAGKHGVDLKGYVNLSGLAEVIKYEKGLDLEAADKERGALIDKLTRRLSKEDILMVVERSISFRLGRISSADYYAYLLEAAEKNGMDLRKTYPHLGDYIIYVLACSGIDNRKLPVEIASCESAIKERLFTGDDQAALEKLSRHIDILLGLIGTRLLSDRFDYYKAHKAEFSAGVFTAFINKEGKRHGLGLEIGAPDESVNRCIRELEKFYTIAKERDRELVENALKEMEREGQDIAVIVAGGFHSEGIARLLHEKGVSYVVISPSMTKDDPTRYIQVLTGPKVPFECLAAGAISGKAQYMLAPSPAPEGDQR